MTLNPAMTEAIAEQRDTESPDRASRGFARQAVVDTLRRTGARFGLVWIGLLVLAAVFSPFIASSFPLLVRDQGRLRCPVLGHLTPSDVVWLAAFLTAVTLAALRRTSFPQFVAIVILCVALFVPLTLWPAVVEDGWLPGSDSMNYKLRWAILIFAGLIDLAILIGLPMLARIRGRLAFILGVVALVSIGLLIAFPVHPPEAIVYQEYRDKQTSGEARVIIPAPIPYSPNDYQRDHPEDRLQPPSARHLMGTEQSAADVFSRLLHASRISLSIGFIATGIALMIAVVVGGIMGFFAGKVDILGMRLIEILEAVPTLILLLTVCAFFGRSLYLMMLIIGLVSWTGDARFIRAEFVRLRKQDFVQAAIAAGLPLRSVIFRHMLANGITPVLVNTSFNVASAILIESVLSFLGLGLVDEPSWGQLLNQARAGGTGFQWWIATFPGMAIFLTVFAYNLIGEAIRDAIDPRLRKRD